MALTPLIIMAELLPSVRQAGWFLQIGNAERLSLRAANAQAPAISGGTRNQLQAFQVFSVTEI
jgi:hypothetical protein